ncbi:MULTISPECIES: hypothetical protein [Pseudomonas]|uniref:hypothetical protein n=1 Tax=Pseudomonas TaxID=286 RepID=UPI0004E36C67|nr:MULTISPECIES: hypothetical protein [Pseudomonas]KFE45636.1 hypothetical protein IV03_14360 [Pseudomonas congelans]MBC8800437.1 hypothetical protein [Pseudomonas congelans]MBP1146158.1 hypothetical protein [Pseudomonas sp. PvP027]QVX12677.1 hypothetical protein DBV21_23790 [Pseudomonas congelans]QVX17650.1 hypothetical protein DB356_24695 [Pseudomonas congelans]
MAFLLLLPLLVSGFLVCLKDPTIYCRLHRYEGQMLYLQVGRYGIYCFLAAMFVTAALAGLFSHDWGVFCPKWAQTNDAASPVCFAVNTDFMGALGQMGQDFDISGKNFSQVGVFLALSGLLTLAMPGLGAFFTVKILKWQLKASKEEEIAAYLLGESVEHSPICSTLFDAFVDKEEVMITMVDRKVYVGYIMDVGAPTEVTGVNQEILLIPTVSGYRDKDTLKVVYTTDYPSDTPLRPIGFRQENIVSISIFSDEVREAFKRADYERAGEETAKEKAAKDQLVKAITELVAVVQAAQR